MEKEIWKPIVVWKKGVKYDYTGIYEVSSLGKIRSLRYRNSYKIVIMTPLNNGQGYLFIGLRNKGKKEQFYLHRIVWETFNGRIPENMQINHLDCNPENNRLENLSLVTVAENLAYGDHALKQRNSQLNNKVTSRPVNQYTIDGTFVKRYPSQKEAERETGITASKISLCCRGVLKYLAKQYYFRYAI